MAQHSRLEIGAPRPWIDDLARLASRDRVDGEIATLQVLLERDRGRGVEREPRVPRRRFALRPRQRVLFAGARVQKYGEVFADAAEPLCDELVGRGADDNPVAFLDRQAEQCITDCAAHLVDSHAGIIP